MTVVNLNIASGRPDRADLLWDWPQFDSDGHVRIWRGDLTNPFRDLIMTFANEDPDEVALWLEGLARAIKYRQP